MVPVRLIRPDNDPGLKVFSEVMKKRRVRKVN
jgi:hypothetical protein